MTKLPFALSKMYSRTGLGYHNPTPPDDIMPPPPSYHNPTPPDPYRAPHDAATSRSTLSPPAWLYPRPPLIHPGPTCLLPVPRAPDVVPFCLPIVQVLPRRHSFDIQGLTSDHNAIPRRQHMR